MPTYSKTSETKLSVSHPDIQKVLRYVIQIYDHSIVDTYRTRAKQHEYFTAVPPLSKVDYPTVHNTRPCWAVDAYPYMDGKINFGNTKEEQRQCDHFAGFVMGVADLMFYLGMITHRFRNGDDWDNDKNINDQTFNDSCHFELIPNPGDKLNYFET